MNTSPGALLSPAVDWLSTHWLPLFACISSVVEASLDQIEALRLDRLRRAAFQGKRRTAAR